MAFLILISASSAQAQSDIFFNRTNNGDFATAANWNTGALPTGFGNTWIGSSQLGSPILATATANLSTDVTSLNTGTLWLGQGPSGNGTLNINAGGQMQYGNLRIGRDAGAVGVLNQTGGTMRINAGTIEIQSGGASGTYNLSGGTLTTINASPTSISVGVSGSGTGYFNMSGGTLNAGTTHQHSMNVGWAAKGEATFSGGTATLTGDLNAGNNGNGLVTVSDSAVVNARSVNVGLNAGASNSRLTVNGGTLSVSNGMIVANSSALNIGGGTVSAAWLRIASGSVMTNTGGTLNIPAITNNGTLTINRADTLSLTGTLSGSGIIKIAGGTLALGLGAAITNVPAVNGGGTLSLGNGGSLVTTNATPTSISIGAEGTGTGYFNMSGGSLDAGTTHEHSLNVGWGARGEAIFSGGVANLTGDLNAGNITNGLVTISGSAVVNAKNVNVGLQAGGTNSKLTINGGTLSVSNGIVVTNSSALSIGGGTVSAAWLRIASGSVMTNTGGTLNIPAITNNGTLTLDRSDALSLTGTLSGSGTTRVLGGTTVSLDNGGAWSGGEIFILSNGLVRFNGGTGNGAASLNLNGGVVDVNGQFLPANSWANLIPRMSGAKLVNSSTSSAAIGSGNNTLWLYTASLEIETVGDLQIDSVIHSTLAPTATGITKTGAGKLTLTATNTYTGGTTVSDGELVIAQANFTANITPSAISVTLSNTPSGGDTFQLVRGPLTGSYGVPSVSNLGAGQSASFDASTGILSITQSSTGPAFDDAYPGNTMTDVAPNGLTYLLNYAFGGSSTTAASLPSQDTSDPAKLTLVAYVRTNNAVGTLTVVGEKGDSLSNFDTANPIAGEVATDQSDAPAGTQKRVFSVPHNGDRLFLRLKATLQ